MNLALAIVFLWAGAMLLTIAFHPLASSGTTPAAVLEGMQANVKAAQGSAYTM